MLKKLFAASILSMIVATTHAEICPSPADIKANNFKDWQAFDIDNGTRLTPARLEKFKNNVTIFSLAEYAPEAPEGTGHCYYDSSHHYDDVFLAKQNIINDPTDPAWFSAGALTMQCQQSREQCLFV